MHAHGSEPIRALEGTALDEKRNAKQPTTSVIVVNWNGKNHLADCLSALQGQTLPPDEIIVVDNGSTDGSIEFLRQCHGIKVLALDANRGFAGGNIAGLELASGDYVVLLNNDTKALPTWLESMVKCAGAYEDVGIVASVMTDWSGTIVDTAGDGCTVSGRGFKRFSSVKVANDIASEYVFGACAGAALYKRDMIGQVGFLDERFYMNAEDTDLAFRANLQGWRSFVCAEAVVRHKISASQGVYSKQAVYYAARNHIWLMFKCMPAPLFYKYLPSTVVHYLSSVGFFAIRGGLLALLRGYWAGFQGLRSFASDRDRIQQTRRLTLNELEHRLELVSTVLLRRVLGLRKGAIK